MTDTEISLKAAIRIIEEFIDHFDQNGFETEEVEVTYNNAERFVSEAKSNDQ